MPGLTQKFTKTRKSALIAENLAHRGCLQPTLLSQQVTKREGPGCKARQKRVTVLSRHECKSHGFDSNLNFYSLRKCHGARNAILLFSLRGRGVWMCVCV